MKIPHRGDFIWLNLDPAFGHEQKGRRPVMVISSREYNQMGMALICPLTSKVKNYAFEVSLKNFNGVVLTDQIRTVDWRTRGFQFIKQADSETVLHVQKNLEKLIKE